MAINFLNTVAVDENVLFVDTVNDRVGIGTASPDKLLDVSSDNTPTIRITNTLQSSSNYTIGAFEFFSEDASTPGGARVLSSILCVNNAGSAVPNGELAFYTALGAGSGAAPTEKMRIDSSGNVGIGTDSPAYKLDVLGSVNNADVGIRINNSFDDNDPASEPNAVLHLSAASNNGYLRVHGAPADTAAKHQIDLGATATYSFLTFSPSGSEKMRIDALGNVGIGTDSLSEKLDVNGNVKIKNALLSNQENTDIDTGAEVVALVAHATYTAAFFDFVVKKGTNVRSGTVYACHNGDTTPLVEFTETSTNDLGDTSDVTLRVDISGANMRLIATVTSDDWSVKSLIRAI